jgi:hypothetical protein
MLQQIKRCKRGFLRAKRKDKESPRGRASYFFSELLLSLDGEEELDEEDGELVPEPAPSPLGLDADELSAVDSVLAGAVVLEAFLA